MRTSIFTAAVLCVFAFGCFEERKGGEAGPDGGPAADGGIRTPATTLGCTAVVECAGKCGEGDQTCQDSCLAKGSAAAKVAAGDLSDCGQKNSCSEPACVTENCQTEVTACQNTKGEEVKPDGPATPGTVPADLVGIWRSLTDRMEFRTDATVTRIVKLQDSTCKTDVLEHGTVVADGSNVTISWTSGTITICNQTDPYQPRTEAFTYSIATDDPANPILTLVKVACTDNCSNRYDKN
jgi:hypothetical protein